MTQRGTGAPRALWWLVGGALLVGAGFFFLRTGGPGDTTPSPAVGTEPIVLRLPSFALNLNPRTMADVESRQVATLLHAGLIQQKQDGTVLPMLAQSWRQEGKDWVFDLKPGVTFSNGMPVTAADVVRSICNSMQPSGALSWALASIAREPAADGKTVKCTGLAAPTDLQVRVTEHKPSSSLLDALGGPAGWVLPGDGVREAEYGVLPGAGPYTVREIVPDSRVVLEARATGAAVQARASRVQFDYISNDSQAAQQFAAGRLHVLDLTSPSLISLMGADPAAGTMRVPGKLEQVEWERYRVVIVNLNALQRRGFTQHQAASFVRALSARVDREGLERMAGGVAKAFQAPYPPTPAIGNAQLSDGPFPNAQFSILTESDAFSDAIAAQLPQDLGGVSMRYRGVDKGVLLKSLFTGDFDLISMLLEAPVRSAEFWQALFTPGNPYSAIGVPIPGMEKLDPSTPEGLEQVGRLIAERGNWVALLKERRIQARAPGIQGIIFTPSGQTNLALIGR